VEKAKKIGTFEEARIASACSTMSPENPSTRVSETRMDELKEEMNIPELVQIGLENAEKNVLRDRKD